MGQPARHLALIVAVAVAVTAAAAQRAGAPRVELRYLGTAGWEISDGQTVVLVDPYLTRPRLVIPNDDTLATDTRPLFTATDIARSDVAVIDAHIQRADFILITHTHIDHVLDMPYIAQKTGAMVVGTESTDNFARASGVPGNKLIVVRGGEDSSNRDPNALGPVQRHVRRVTGAGARAAAVARFGSEGRVAEKHGDRPEVFRTVRHSIAERSSRTICPG